MLLEKPAGIVKPACKYACRVLLAFFMTLLFPAVIFAQEYPQLTRQQQNWLAEQIFNNECARRIECLTSWNAGEDFPSLGIGHFIWYQADQTEIFAESFPALLEFFMEEGISVPEWIIAAGFNSPWQSRAEFLADYSGPRLSELRELLAATMPEQTAFIIQRFAGALDKILELNPENAALIEENFYAVANASPPYGLYALIDYVNFKGEGVAAEERYAGQGWGLMQVLEKMPEGTAPLQAFVSSASLVLQNRVENAPAERNETRWLPGWNQRLETYLPAEEY
tara:strand:- start:2380 stop:3225 length:846 start_codon:yes stop_codon:yes gene_type:complete